MNFTYVIILPKVLEFGAKSNNGSWSGMVAQISRGEIDIGNFCLISVSYLHHFLHQNVQSLQ
jgi:hypothetical protein